MSLSVPLTSSIPSVLLLAGEEGSQKRDMIDWLSTDNRNWKGEVTPWILCEQCSVLSCLKVQSALQNQLSISLEEDSVHVLLHASH